MDLLVKIEQKAPVKDIIGHLLECPSDEATNPGAAAQLQKLLSERGIDLNAAYASLDADGSGSITHQEFRCVSTAAICTAAFHTASFNA